MTDNEKTKEKEKYENILEIFPNFTKIRKSLPKKYKKSLTVEAEKTSPHRIKAYYTSDNGYILEIVITTQYGDTRIFSTSVSRTDDQHGRYQIVVDKVQGYSPNVVTLSVIDNGDHTTIIEEKDLGQAIDNLKQSRKELKQVKDEIKWMKKVLKKIGYTVVKNKDDLQ